MSAPSTYCDEVADRICAALMDGQSLAQACKAKGMPSRATVYRWLREHPELVDQYRLAREVQAHGLLDAVIEIAHGKVGKDANKARVRLDAAKWAASRLLPEQYGEKSTTTLKGDSSAPLIVEIKAYTMEPAD